MISQKAKNFFQALREINRLWFGFGLATVLSSIYLIGPLVTDNGSSTSEADCMRLEIPVATAAAVFSSNYSGDGFDASLVLKRRSNKLQKLSSQISGPASDIATRMSITLSSKALEFLIDGWATGGVYWDQIDELIEICPSLDWLN